MEMVLEHAAELIAFGALLILVSVMLGQLASRLGAPLLVTFLGVGIFFGEDGPGGIIFNDKETAYLICSIALAMILFDGGLRTPLRMFQRAFKPALSLATLGVLLTAAITGAAASWLLGLNAIHGLLIGSIVASTDAAAVFLLLHQRGIHLREDVSATLEVESSINDPMAVFLTITCVSLLAPDAQIHGAAILGMFVKQMGLGAMVGFAGGRALTFLLRMVRLDAGLYPAVVMAGGLLIFGGTHLVGGSGFLAVYIAGVTFANGGFQKLMLIKHFNDGMAWIAQLVMLLTLGFLVTPSKLVDYIVPAVVIAVVLVLVARPAAVMLCLARSKFRAREKFFISWVGLRGAIPIYLALIPALSGIEDGQFYFNIAFIIVVVSLIFQGWTINPLAQRLGLIEKKPEHPAAH